jgi:hypothetical protein
MVVLWGGPSVAAVASPGCNGVRGKPKVLEIPGANTEILGANNGCGCKDTGCKACVDDYKRRGVVT